MRPRIPSVPIIIFGLISLILVACASTGRSASPAPAPTPTSATALAASSTSPFPAIAETTPTGVPANAAQYGVIRRQFQAIPRQRRSPSSPEPTSTAPTTPSIADKVFQVNPGEALETDLDVESTFPGSHTLTMILLLNYRQVSYSVDGQATTEVFDIALTPNAQQHYHLRTASLAEGYYDLALVLIWDEHRDPCCFETTFTPEERRSVYVGTAAIPPPPNYQPFAQREATNRFPGSVCLCRYADQMQRWGAQVGTPGQMLTGYLRTSPSRSNVTAQHPDGAVPEAYVAFLDDHIVPINGQAVTYALGQVGQLQTLPFTVQAPSTPGSHPFFIARFPNPYVEPVTYDATSAQFHSDTSSRHLITISA